MRVIIDKTAKMIKKKLEGEGSGHDWWHIYRVWQMSKRIAKTESCNLYIVELGALLHDIADFKFHNGDEQIGGVKARDWLQSLKLNREDIDQVVHIVDNISFKGASEINNIQSIEGKIVQDADRLDAMGAIGIARCFAYGGSKSRVIYDPKTKPALGMGKMQYKTNTGTSINHFYEKLLLLKDLMNTNTAREIAIRRDEFMKSFLDEFYLEWENLD